MRLILLVAGMLLLGLGAAAQQTLQTQSKKNNNFTITYGVYGNAFVGAGSGFYSKVEPDLQKNPGGGNVLSDTSGEFLYKGLSTVYGLDGNLLYKNFIFTLRAAWQESTTSETVRGSARTTSRRIGGTVGYALYNRNQWLAYPYLGYSSTKNTLLLANFAIDNIQFGDQEIEPNRSGEFETTTGQVEIGVGSKYLINKKGGLLIGAELGGYLPLGDDNWTNKDGGAAAEGTAAFSFSAVYLRFTIGFGGFQLDRAKDKAVDGEPTELPAVLEGN